MPAIRRFLFDSAQGRVVEVPLTRDEFEFVQHAFRIHVDRRPPVVVGVDLAAPAADRTALISPAPHPERMRLESLLALFILFDEMIEQINRSDPGAVDDTENLEKTLVELARDGKKADFYFLAQASAGIPQAKLDEVWTGARRRLRLVP